MLTESQAKALNILKDHGPLSPRQFARLMWPDSPGWCRVSKCGPYGSTRGGGMNLAGGGYLGKLHRKGWVEPSRAEWPLGQHCISAQGLEALREETAHEG